jgi:hypothetical protein
MSLGARQRFGPGFGLGRAPDLDTARDVRRPTVTDPKKRLPGLSVLFSFSVFVVAAILAVTSIFEIALREQVLTLVKSEKDRTYSQLFRQVSLTPALGDERALKSARAIEELRSEAETLRAKRDMAPSTSRSG